MSTQTRPRHRADLRPSTPLTAAASTVADTFSGVAAPTFARRAGLAIVVSSGLVATLAMPADAESTAHGTGATATQVTAPTDAEDQASTWPSQADTGTDTGSDTDTGTDSGSAPAANTVTDTATDTATDTDGHGNDAATPSPAPPAHVPAPRAPRHALPRPAPTPSATARKVPRRATATPGSRVVTVAMRYRGVPYVWGGTTPRGFDCSGFTRYVYAQVGHRLPRTVADQRAAATRIPRSKARPGDLIFFGTHHTGIYLGGNRMIAAPRRGKTVQPQDIYSANVTFGRV
jgi:cell wall-associated NlpC family hydrolase